MDVRIHSIHFDADQKLLDFIDKKITRLERVFARVTEVEVFLKLDALNGSTHSKVAEIKVNIPGKTIFSREQTYSFEDSVEIALDHAVTQVKKHKEKLQF